MILIIIIITCWAPEGEAPKLVELLLEALHLAVPLLGCAISLYVCMYVSSGLCMYATIVLYMYIYVYIYIYI